MSIDDRLRQMENDEMTDEVFDAPSPDPDDECDFAFGAGGPQTPPLIKEEPEEPQVYTSS